MLPKKQRLTTKAFTTLFPRGNRFDCPSFYAKYGPDTATRFAVVVTAKVAPAATRRNYLRRIGYEALAKISPYPPISAIIFLKKTSSALTKESLETAFRLFFQSIRTT